MSMTDRDVVDALRTTLKERDRLRQENARLLSSSDEPVAIVGMSCRFPGGVETPEQLWEVVAAGRDEISGFPEDRGWEAERIYNPDPDVAGTTYVREGGFLVAPGDSDAEFFGMSPREALASDSQQRLILECGWEALEAAGLNPLALKRSQTGVFVGVMMHDYGAGSWPTDLEGYLSSGASGSVASGRLAYTLGLEGPAITVDTACSSSLVAIHLAVQALRKGECSLALAGGATVFSTPGVFIDASRQRSLAPDGRCKAFAETADGVGFAEGAGLVAIERLSDAQRNGHDVLAVIRGSAINQDGASNGLAAPSGPAQERVIRQALANARLTPQDVDLVEAHGTGTTLGDPIEANALLATYGQERERPLRLGSVKSNIGHTQAAAGVGGVIKTVMAMREEVMPKTLHVDAPSSKVDWETGSIELLTEPREWRPNDRPRRAGVSSFGMSGTNAHLVLEEAPRDATEAEVTEVIDGRGEARATLPGGHVPLVLSAKSDEALQESAGRLAAHLERNPNMDPLDVAYTLATRRPAFERRAVAVGEGRDDLRTALAAFASGGETPGLVEAVAHGERRPVFLFPGYGSQWQGMALELIESSPVFAKRMRECAEALDPYMDWSLEQMLRGAEGLPPIDEIEVGGPMLFATTVSLVELWRSCGVEPAAVAGHSQGELIAAHVAGALTLEETARAVVLRSKVIRALVGHGAMASAALSAEELGPRLERWGGRLEIAAMNGPASTIVSGDREPMEEFLAQCEAEGTHARRIRGASGASHSSHVEALRDDMLEAFATISPRSGEIPFHSTVTGGVLDTAELLPEYWYRNLRQTVRLAPVVSDLIEAGNRTLIEISPHPVLTVGLQETAAAAENGRSVSVLGTLRRDDGGPRRFAVSFAEAQAAGAAIDWDVFFAEAGAAAVSLPTYPFQRKRYWLTGSAAGSNPSALGLGNAEHPLLGAAIEDPERGDVTLAGRISLQSHPWLADHAGAGMVLFPGTGFVELALRAGQEVECGVLEELVLEAPLLLPDVAGVALRVVVSGGGERGERAISIYSRPEEPEEGGERPEWARHARGTVSATQPRLPGHLAEWPPPGADPLGLESFYDQLAAAGFEYGPAFEGLTAAWRAGEEVFAEVSLATEQASEAARFGVHPALLDSALHGILLASLTDEVEELSPKLPFVWENVAVLRPGASALRVRISPKEDDAISLVLADEDGAPVATVGSVRARAVSPAALGGTLAKQDGLLGVSWTEIEPGGETAPVPDATRLVELAELGFEATDDMAATARAAVERALAEVQGWLATEDRAGSRLVLLTRGAAATTEVEDPDLPGAAVRGLLRSAQTEHPGRIGLIDSDGSKASSEALAAAIVTTSREPELALREGRLLAPRLLEAGGSGDALMPPAGPWDLAVPEQGTLEGLSLVPNPRALEPLEPGQVRIAVRAGGLNFRDVMSVLGVYPGEARIGGEGAGVVVEVGPEVSELAVGDRVLGMMPAAFGPLTVAAAQLLVPLPAGWSFEQGAGVPIAYATAYFGLIDIAALEADARVLVHAGAGGVGMAAVKLALHRGAEVFATASPAKWEALRELGIAADHIASSRDLEFRERFLEQTGGEGVDVVLNSLAGEFVDASLDLMPRGGRFLEMGKTDLREPERVAAEHPGVSYRAYDLGEPDFARMREIFATVVDLLDAGALAHSPVQGWDVRRAPEAFRHLREGNNVGKVVLTIPQPVDPDRTVLITGGTGGLGSVVARHLVERHGAHHLLLASRSGPDAPDAAELSAGLEELGAAVRIEACDVSDRTQLEALLGSIDPEHPLGAVIHAAGVLADGTIESMDAEQIERVFAPKLDAAWHLHELTSDLDLSAFVLFSSLAATLGTPGQANYAAANAFLDALAAARRAEGLVATSMAWGVWAESGGAGAALDDADLARMERAGVAALSDERGLELFDAALGADLALTVPAPFNRAALRRAAEAGALPPVLAGLVSAPRRRRATAADGLLAAKLAKLGEAEREPMVLDLLRGEIAAVLGHDSLADVDPDRAFKELGFDSLAAVELRNRVNATTGLELPTAVVFDYPSPRSLACYLVEEATGGAPAEQAVVRTQTSEEPIAIVGMACRFPGGVDSPRGLWELVADGRDGITEFPVDRGWDLGRLYHPDPDHPGSTYVREGGFLHDAAYFDPVFFGMSPREALATDPQQRLLLETVWESLEDAGIDPSTLRGSPTGMFAGLSSADYAFGFGDTGEGLEGYRMTGIAASVASGRVSYQLGLEGPAMTVDTACSSSLVATHLAAAALRSGECSLALAGGATVLATPNLFVEFSRQRGSAADGRCKSFAEAADGVGSSEGVGILTLERLSDAEANGHRVLATIRGSAVNQDGASNGLTAPNGPSQERVIRQALANARLEPRDVDAVEAHGTGTLLGDPIEAGALLATYGQEREQPLHLGSIKSNIGHAQAAAGVAGVIKTVMAMREGMLPKTLHVDRPSSRIEWEAGKIELLTEPVEWRPNGHPRRAAVSSFGISGTNAHLILEEGPRPEAEERDPAAVPGPLPIVLTAKSAGALRESAARLASHLEHHPQLALTDVAHSLLSTRAAMEQRAALAGDDREQLLAGLRALASGESGAGTYTAAARGGRLAFLFTGQGAQRAGMGRELYETYPAYAKALDEACEALDRHLDCPIVELAFSEPGSKEAELLDHTTYAQPALFATEVALYRLLESFGLKPDLLAGHSIGEIVAAHLAGVVSLADAAVLVCARGRLMGDLPEDGAMLAIEATEEEASESLAGREELLSIAAVNGPRAVVISGDAGAIARLEACWQEQGRKTKRLAVSHAFHSPLIEPMLEEFSAVVEGLELRPPALPVVSNTTGQLLSAAQATDPAYWVAHARRPVRFADAIRTLEGEGATTYLELGPDPVLTAIAAAALETGEKAALIPTLREGREDPGALVLALGSAYASGAAVQWGSFFAGRAPKAVPLPTYPFQRKPYWLSAARTGSDPSANGQAAAGHPFLGAAIEDPEGRELLLTGRISLQSHPWLADHVAGGAAILPGAAFVEMALAAGRAVGFAVLQELTLQAPLPLPGLGGVQLQVRVGPGGEAGERPLSIHARQEGEAEEAEGHVWALYAEGVLAAEKPLAADLPAAWPPAGAEPLDLGSIYDRFAGLGFDYGPAFQGLTAAWRLGEDLYAEVSLAEAQAAEAERYGVHPALLDAAMQANILRVESDRSDGEDELRLPFAWRGISLSGAAPSELRVKISFPGEEEVSLEFGDGSGAPVGRVGSMRVRPFQLATLAAPGAGDGLLALEWTPLAASGGETAAAASGGETAPAAVRTVSIEELDFGPSDDPIERAHAAARSALTLIQADLTSEGEGDSPLALLSANAVATAAGEVADLGGATVLGMLRSAQAEHPGRFALIDSDGSEASRAALEAALALSAEEPQLAIREGRLLVPRIGAAPASGGGEPATPGPIDPDRTVLITGGTGRLGALLARHLVECHGARHLLLASRGGLEAAGAPELSAGLGELGAAVRIESCDVSNRAALESMLDSIAPEHPLGAVIHAAGALADGVIESMDAEQIERVFAPKLDAAWHLHELTKDLDLSAFVLFSSLAGMRGAPAQANYAAANAFLDALAQRRRSESLATTSIAWGRWGRESDIASGLSEIERTRMRRLGAEALSDEEGLVLFDAALRLDGAVAIAARIDRASLRRLSAAGLLPPILRGLIPRRGARRPLPAVSLADKLAGLPPAEHEAVALGLVRGEVAIVLGHSSAEEVPVDRPFNELGFDSLAAVELRNRLGFATSLRLPATLVFDYPTSAALAGYLLSEIGEKEKAGAEAELSRFEAALGAIAAGDPRRQSLAAHLRALASDLEGNGAGDAGDAIDRLESASDEELLEFIDEQVTG
jgi:polyene macrolide polyketide synthase